MKGIRCETLMREIMVAAVLSCLGESPPIRNEAAFRQACASVRPRLQAVVRQMALTAQECLSAAQRIAQALNKPPAPWKNAVADMRAQLDGLVFPGFLPRHPTDRLPHLPRYLKAMELRLGKLPHHLARDQGCMNEMAGLLAAWRRRYEQKAEPGARDEALEDFRWQLEELRVSLFAQELKTPTPISVKRLEKRWREIAA